MFGRILFAKILLYSIISFAVADDVPAGTPEINGLPQSASIAFGASAPVPAGYYELCKGGERLCKRIEGTHATATSGAVRLTASLAKHVAAVNRRVNKSIRPLADVSHFGVVDRWDISPRSGDCEDYALTKKAKLIEHGWPSGALLIATAVTQKGEQHAVLIVRTDRGDLVLDNLTDEIRGWRPDLYQWKTIQSPDETWVWHRIEKKVQVASRASPSKQARPTQMHLRNSLAVLSGTQNGAWLVLDWRAITRPQLESRNAEKPLYSSLTPGKQTPKAIVFQFPAEPGARLPPSLRSRTEAEAIDALEQLLADEVEIPVSASAEVTADPRPPQGSLLAWARSNR